MLCPCLLVLCLVLGIHSSQKPQLGLQGGNHNRELALGAAETAVYLLERRLGTVYVDFLTVESEQHLRETSSCLRFELP